MELSGVLGLGLLGGLLVAGGYVLVRFDKRRRLALQEACAALGFDGSQGTVNGVPVEITLRSEQTDYVAVAAVLGLDFNLTIQQAGAWPLRDVSIEPSFDKACAVQTDQPERALSLLEDPAVRETVREFIRAGTGCSEITQERVLFKVVDAHLRGSASILRAVELCLGVVRALTSGKPEPER